MYKASDGTRWYLRQELGFNPKNRLTPKSILKKLPLKEFCKEIVLSCAYDVYVYTAQKECYDYISFEKFFTMEGFEVKHLLGEMIIFKAPWGEVYFFYTGVDSGGYDACWKARGFDSEKEFAAFFSLNQKNSVGCVI